MPLRLVPPIHRATHRIGLYLAGLKDEALSQGEAHILALLATSGPATIADLHRGLAHKRSTLTSILDRLAARGFVTSAVGSADRRTFVVTPTAMGRRVATRVHRHLTDLERAAATRVSSDDIRGFMKVLAAVEDEAHRRTAHPRKSQVASLKSHSRRSRG
jgi:DNA-binding MarR family transcriptional regulator